MHAWTKSEFFKDLNLVVKYNSDLLRDHWGPKQTISWLREADIYVILCHSHQGLKNPRWDCSELMLSMRPLEYRLGFPSAENLRCPMFSQNKWNSLSCLKDRINFTLPIAMGNLENYMSHLDKLVVDSKDIFLKEKGIDVEEYADNVITYLESVFDNTNGWVLKFPFKTNGKEMSFCSNSQQLKTAIIRNYFYQETGEIIPYGLLQPRLLNR